VEQLAPIGEPCLKLCEGDASIVGRCPLFENLQIGEQHLPTAFTVTDCYDQRADIATGRYRRREVHQLALDSRQLPPT
jgi:hypothetical protein